MLRSWESSCVIALHATCKQADDSPAHKLAAALHAQEDTYHVDTVESPAALVGDNSLQSTDDTDSGSVCITGWRSGGQHTWAFTLDLG